MSTAMEDVKADWYKGRMRLRKAALWVVEGLAVLIVLLALALGVLTWRVASGPLDLDFAKDHLTEMLEDPHWRGGLVLARPDRAVIHRP